MSVCYQDLRGRPRRCPLDRRASGVEQRNARGVPSRSRDRVRHRGVYPHPLRRSCRRCGAPLNPRLAACYFDAGYEKRAAWYTRLAAVLDRTARTHLPEWDIRIEEIPPPSAKYISALGNPSHVWNTAKLEWWRDQILDAPDGARVLLIDGDTAIIRPLDSVWDLDFDLAYTVRPPGGYPFNGGVVFVRCSPKTRAFFKDWFDVNVAFLGDAARHTPYRMKYAGMNQSSFGYLLEQGVNDLAFAKLPCEEWNACAPALYHRNVSRIIHIKSSVRRALFEQEPEQHSQKELIRTWRKLEAR